jgi:hypothetical protein
MLRGISILKRARDLHIEIGPIERVTSMVIRGAPS